MKIVYISNSIIPSKTANSIHVMKMCQAFASHGHEVILLAPNRHKEFEQNIADVYEYYNVKKDFEIKYLPYSYIKYFGIVYYSLNIYKRIKEINPDLVYGRDLYGCFLSSFNYKTFFEAHAPMNNYIKRVMLNLMSQNKNYIKTVVISNVLKNIMLSNQLIHENQYLVAHDGADEVSDFTTTIKTISENGKLNVGYVGSLYKGKGVEIIVELAKDLPNVQFHIIGGKENEIEYWKKNSNADNIIFYGFFPQNKLGQYFNSFDICLLPNQKEVYIENKLTKQSDIGEYTSPLKMFEYMAHKKVIIASDLKVLKEVLNNKNSILVTSNSPSEWIDGINKLKDKKLSSQLSKQVYLDFKEYTWKNRVKNIMKDVYVTKK